MSSGPFENDQDGPSKERETLIENTNDIVGGRTDEGGIGQSVKDEQLSQPIEAESAPVKHTAVSLQEGESAILPQDATIPSSADLVRTASATSAGQDDGQSASNGAPSVPISSPGLASANAVKKFNSLSVAKQFLQKASPTLGNAAAAPIASTKAASGIQSGQSLSSSSRLSSMVPASRLTSAKLTTSSKPAGTGWAQVSSPASTPRTAAETPSGASAGSANAASTAPAQSTSGQESAASPATTPAAAPHSSVPASVNAPSPAAPSPRLVTALSARSTSPHVRNVDGSKGSPGLKNAAIAGSGRSASPSVNNATGSVSRAPWAAVKTDTKAPAKGIGRRSDFPTAAEAAQAKLEAEKKEKAAAAEAALKAEQALQNLEKFRGTGLGTHWDEMDDDDFGEGELQFGDGSSYRVPAQQVEKQITKEERFRDVGHDRSWPGQNAPSQPGQRSTPPVKPPQQPERTKPHKVETVAVRSGEGISLDAPSTIDRGPSFYGGGGHQKERRSSFLGRSREPREDHGHSSASHAAPPVAQVRAWGPLAQRQASLNPDAPKPAPAVPAAIQSPPTSSTGGKEAIPQDANVGDKVSHERSRKPAHTQPASIVSPPTRPITDGRALPPHLALNRQSQPSQQPLHRHSELGTVERPDWQTAVPRQIEEEAQPKEVIARPYGSFVASSRQSHPQAKSNTSSGRPESSRRKESFSTAESAEDRASALERARKRKEAEEAERTKERERALAKAAAIEAKMREAEEAEKEKKRAAEEERQRIQREAQKAEEAKREAELQTRNKAARDSNVPPRGPRNRTSFSGGDVPPHTALQVSTSSNVPGSSLLSPSDEAVSWRRAPKIPLQTAAPGMTEETNVRGDHRKQEVQPHKVLLRRPDGQLNEDSDRAKAAGKREQDNERVDKTVGTASRDGRRSERSRVEIIAPTDEGATKHMRAQQEREREARQNKDGIARVPVGVLKPATAMEVEMNRQKAQRVPVLPEPEQTRTEVPFDGAPVWNKFQVRVGKRTEKPKSRLSRDEFKAQQDRIAKAKDQSDRYAPKPVSILSWSPPIVDLSARTLSRDDQFFPKKYRKGVRIANVIMPRASISELAEENAKKREIDQANAVKASKPVDSQSFNAGIPGVASTASKPAVRVPAVSSIPSADVNPAIDSFDNRNAIPTGPRSQQRNRDVNGAVGFARSDIAREAATPSPVSFTVQSEVDAPINVPSVMLGNNNLVTKKSASTSTWGENSLTFAGLDSSGNGDGASSLIQNDSVDAENERNRIKDVWGSLPSDPANEQSKPTQNSLKDIVDDLPSAISMSVDELRADDMSSQNAEGAHPTHTRLYTPMVDGNRGTAAAGNNVARVGTNGGALNDVAVMTAASSPVNVASPSQSSHLFGGDDVGRRANLHHQIGRARSQSPSSMRYSSSTATTNSNSNHLLGMTSPSSNTTMTSAGVGHHQRNMFVQQERGGATAAFGPYAYPSKTGYSSGMLSTPSQQQQQQQYSAYGSGQGGFNAQSNYGTADYGLGYGNNAYGYNSRGYRGNPANPAASAMGGQNALQGYDSFGNTANEAAFNAFDSRGTYPNTSMLAGSGGEMSGNETSASNFGSIEGMEDGSSGMTTTASTAGWPLDSPAGSYMGSNYSTQPNAYFTGFNSGSPATGASGYGGFGQQPSQGMGSSYGRSASQRNGFISGTGTYRGSGGSMMANGYSNNGVGGQWGTRGARTYGTNPTDLTASTTNLYQAPQIYQTGGNKGFDNNRLPAGTSLQATAKPFQLGGNPTAGSGMTNRGRGAGGGASRYQQGYPRVASGGSEMEAEGVQQQYTNEYGDAYNNNNGQW
ncbi:uncharacterized protein FA14DRAFT_180724 [Meira miltonrushii]|uniref:Uncharacterized protein n=1 Tax=Meira miltonrushii TaxID=1280837 RepID=A0A316VF40_9BASI|nr:uncharacterized protein FA14DRAFT_180724 [Meira miltonrushii]PWN34095.1 hypothetical protein FA14DRAFT_180724 [Meira miltonrushii]